MRDQDPALLGRDAALADRPRLDVLQLLAVILTAVALQIVVFGLLFPHLWYGVHDISDVPIYQGYAGMMADHLRPYRDFQIEYPPLAIPLFAAAGHSHDLDGYFGSFAFEMIVFTLVTAVIVALAAHALWPHGWRALLAVILFAAAVAGIGTIIENRYDTVVALTIALLLLCLVTRHHTLAGVAVGVGFALKLTPLALLPLVLLLVPARRKAVSPTLGFLVAAALPFIPALMLSPAGVWHVIDYHLRRPLQIESVLGTPIMLAHVLGHLKVTVLNNFGSQNIAATGAKLAASASGALMVLAVFAAYLLIVRRRALLRAAPQNVPLAVLALILAVMVFGKVLSPQYFIWTLPAVAMVALRERLLGVLCFATLLLTQVEFPAMYWNYVELKSGAVAVVAVRNVLLVVTFGYALWRLWRLPESPGEAVT